jgi:hypothetical protein
MADPWTIPIEDGGTLKLLVAERRIELYADSALMPTSAPLSMTLMEAENLQRAVGKACAKLRAQSARRAA